MIDKIVIDKLEFSKVLSYISKYAVTLPGQEEVLNLYPLDDDNAIIKEGKLVEEAKSILINNNTPPLEYLPNLSEAISQSGIEGAVLDSKKILDILKLLTISNSLLSFVKSNHEIAPELGQIVNGLYTDKLLQHHIQKIIGENGEVKDNASPKLIEIRREIADKNDELIRSVNRIIKSLQKDEIVREDYVTLRDGRIVIPVKVEHKRHIKGFIHSESATGQTVYIEPEETLELNNDLISLSFAEKREIERLLRELTKKIGQVKNELHNNLLIISNIDSIFARAHYSIEIIGSFPQINNKRLFEIIDGRHPILLKKYGRINTVPLNLKFYNKNVLLITGPNAGGKTVVLKTIGLLSLMVKSGIHIPVQPDSNFILFRKILVDIGDQQSLEDDLSTFSSHLNNTRNIINEADENSLVLLDEIGTGTDPAKGSALAAAILITLKEKDSFVFASTHHGNLKVIANEVEGFENGAMEFDHEELKPTYNFKQGIPGSSYAFEIAKRIGFNEDFLEIASSHLNTDEHRLETFLVEVEERSKSFEKKIKQAEIENSRLIGLSNLYKQNLAKLEKEKKDILKKTKNDAEDLLRGINKKIEQTIKDIKEANANKEIIKISHSTINNIKENVRSLVNDNEKIEDTILKENNFVTGEFVNIKDTGTSGEIIEILKDGKNALIKTGNIKIKVNLNNLITIKRPKEKAETSYSSISELSPGIRLDIRGERSDEVEFQLLTFLDNAYTSGLERVEILHGKGTGALKKTVHQILKAHEKVKNFYFAPVEFGGEGITIVELK